MKTSFFRSLFLVIVLLGMIPGATAQDADQWPAIGQFLTNPVPANTPAISLSVGGYPVDVQIPTPGGLSYVHDQLGQPAAASDLQQAIDAHSGDANLGDPNSVGYRLRVVIRGLMDFSAKQNGTARELTLRSRTDFSFKAKAVTAADRRDAAVTLATWAALELFRAEGGDFSPAALKARASDLTVSVDWRKIELSLRPMLGISASDDPSASPAGGKRYIAQSITFEPARIDNGLGSKVLDAGQDGGGVEIFTWHPTPAQLNRGFDAIRVRVDIPQAQNGQSSWQSVRAALPAETYNPESYAALNPGGNTQAVLTTLLRVAYSTLTSAQEAYRRELVDFTNGDDAKFKFWRDRAGLTGEYAGCPSRLRAAALSYLAARYWSEGLRATLVRAAGIGALSSAGPVPPDSLFAGR